jgi:uncharacterized protein with ATP-grasp and redox domains
MNHDPRCYDCLLSRVELEIELVESDKKSDKKKISDTYSHAEELIRFLHTTPLTHPMIASELHRSIYRKLGSSDPFYALKQDSDEVSRKILNAISGRLSGFRDYVLASVIGNMFDYGVKGHEVCEDFVSYFDREFSKGLAIDDTEKILPLCTNVLYFTDNCGEIVFDQALISWLISHGSTVTLVVRDGPILNDATLEDAKRLGLNTQVHSILTTGAGVELGIRFDLLPEEVRIALENCSIIISKGMANYESLREEQGLPPIAYLLAAKCNPIAEELGVSRGDKLAVLKNI